MPLYQDIMKVPGLTGTWQQRNQQLYNLLGNPMGAYSGNLNQNLYLLDQLSKNNYFVGGLPGQTQNKQTQGVSTGTQQGQDAGNATKLTPFADILAFNSYFNPELAQGSAEQAYANYYAPLVQQDQNTLESNFAGRGLTRSGLRSQGIADLYNKYGQDQQAGVEADVLQQKANAQQEYNMLQTLYENSEGKQKPANTTYTPYKVQRPVTAAGTYGTSYLDWFNKATGQTNPAQNTPTSSAAPSTSQLTPLQPTNPSPVPSYKNPVEYPNAGSLLDKMIRNPDGTYIVNGGLEQMPQVKHGELPQNPVSPSIVDSLKPYNGDVSMPTMGGNQYNDVYRIGLMPKKSGYAELIGRYLGNKDTQSPYRYF